MVKIIKFITDLYLYHYNTKIMVLDKCCTLNVRREDFSMYTYELD